MKPVLLDRVLQYYNPEAVSSSRTEFTFLVLGSALKERNVAHSRSRFESIQKGERQKK